MADRKCRGRQAVLLVAAAMLVLIAPVHGRFSEVASNNQFNKTVADVKRTMLTDPRTALRRAKKAEVLANDIADSRSKLKAITTVRWLQGEALIRIGDIYKAEPLINEAYSNAHHLLSHSQLEGDILLSRGSIFGTKAEVRLALISYQQAYVIFARNGDHRSESKALLCISQLYTDANDFKSALRYIDQANNIYIGDSNLILSMLNNRGIALEGLAKYPQAEDQYIKALAVAQGLSSPLLETVILSNIARIQVKSNRLNAASDNLTRAFQIIQNYGSTTWQPKLVAIAAQVALQRGEYNKAPVLILRRFNTVNLNTTDLSARDAHQTAFEIYLALAEPGPALAHLMALRRLDEQATQLATSAGNALLAARFDYANQNLRIANLKADDLRRSVALERERARFQVYVFAGTIAVIAAVIAALAFALVTLRRSSRKVQAANDDLATTNVALGKALATKTEFLATTSHEIRTPLNGILGMTQVMLADRSLAPDLRERLTVVHGAGETMRALVDDILDVAKIETGKLTVENIAFDLRATIVTATRLWEDQARAKELTFVRTLESCPTMIEGDPARVRQIVFNLLSNAMKFTRTGEVALSVVADGPCYRIVVCDTGIGIAADKLEQIFESFRQADTSTTRRFGGTGLGLAICRSLAHAMGGEIAVDSVAGQGASFTVTLPLVAAERAAPLAIGSASGTPALLIVDRNPITRSMFRTLLGARTDAITFAGDLDEIATCVTTGTIAQMLIDEATVRTEGDVCETLAAIVTLAQGTDVRTVLLRASAANPDDEEALWATGINAILTKPIAGATLITALFNDPAASAANRSLVSHAA